MGFCILIFHSVLLKPAAPFRLLSTRRLQNRKPSKNTGISSIKRRAPGKANSNVLIKANLKRGTSSHEVSARCECLDRTSSSDQSFRDQPPSAGTALRRRHLLDRCGRVAFRRSSKRPGG